MKKMLILAAALSLSSGAVFADHHAAGAMSFAESSLGKVLVNGEKLTLYTFDNDTAGTSNCYDSCADAWPPMPAEASSKADGDFTVVERTDGSFQWAYKGMPLYTWAGDSAPGDVTGDGVGGVWHVVKKK